MKVSCILPTRGRHDLATQAVECFASQTYPDKELIIVDDADDPSFRYGILRPDSLYVTSIERLNIAAKRQLCCEYTTGDVIAHFDSDDYSDPRRLEVLLD